MILRLEFVVSLLEFAPDPEQRYACPYASQHKDRTPQQATDQSARRDSDKDVTGPDTPVGLNVIGSEEP